MTDRQDYGTYIKKGAKKPLTPMGKRLKAGMQSLKSKKEYMSASPLARKYMEQKVYDDNWQSSQQEFKEKTVQRALQSRKKEISYDFKHQDKRIAQKTKLFGGGLVPYKKETKPYKKGTPYFSVKHQKWFKNWDSFISFDDKNKVFAKEKYIKQIRHRRLLKQKLKAARFGK